MDMEEVRERARPMTTVTLQFPDDVFSALRRSPDEFGRELRVAAAILWYERGEISQEKAALVAGLSRTQFLLELARRSRLHSSSISTI